MANYLIGQKGGAIVLAMVAVAGAHANLVNNGSFELGTNPGSFSTVSTGGSNITGWSVTSGSVDYIGTYWQAAEGNRSVDMSGNSLGRLSQSFATVAGVLYDVTFAYSANPDSPNGGLRKTDVNIRETDTSNLLASTQVTWSVPTEGNTRSNMKWKTASFSFVAADAATTIQFDSLATNSFGIAIDDVKVVQAVPEPTTIAGLGLAAVAFLRRKKK